MCRLWQRWFLKIGSYTKKSKSCVFILSILMSLKEDFSCNRLKSIRFQLKDKFQLVLHTVLNFYQGIWKKKKKYQENCPFEPRKMVSISRDSWWNREICYVWIFNRRQVRIAVWLMLWRMVLANTVWNFLKVCMQFNIFHTFYSHYLIFCYMLLYDNVFFECPKRLSWMGG